MKLHIMKIETQLFYTWSNITMLYPSGSIVVGTLILLTLLYILLKINKIEISDVFTSVGFMKLYNEKPLVLFTSLAVIAFVAYGIYMTIRKTIEGMDTDDYNGYKDVHDVNKICSNLDGMKYMSFDMFYQTYIIKPSKENINQYVISPDSFMVFRTQINGMYYYLTTESIIEQNLPYKNNNLYQNNKDSDRPELCAVGLTGAYVVPVLMREDLLQEEYKQFLNRGHDQMNKEVIAQKAITGNLPAKIVEQFGDLDSMDSPKDSVNSSIDSSKDSIGSDSSKDVKTVVEPPIMTEVQKTLNKTIYPRYAHHFSLTRRIPVESSNQNTNQNDRETRYYAPCYGISGLTKDQTADISNIPQQVPYTMNLNANFSPFTVLRKREITEIQEGTSLTDINLIKREVEVISDKKFVCSTQRPEISKYGNFYAETTPILLGQHDQIKINDVGGVQKINMIPSKTTDLDNMALKGIDNDVIKMAHKINLYIYGDFKKQDSSMHRDIKCWLSYLNGFTDPTNVKTSGTVDDDNRENPKYIPIGILPDDYNIECRKFNDGSYESKCIGRKYIDNIDYSDAKKITFEVIVVKTKPF